MMDIDDKFELLKPVFRTFLENYLDDYFSDDDFENYYLNYIKWYLDGNIFDNENIFKVIDEILKGGE